jgi:protein gp37
MAQTSNIEWTDATWNPLSGCSRKSPGCENCYAEKMTKRLALMGQAKYQGLLNGQNRFNGVIKLDEKALLEPLRWKKPRKVFVNSMSDLFHENALDEWIDKVFAVMALTPQHTYQILTKRPERMKDYFDDPDRWCEILRLATTLGKLPGSIVADFAFKGVDSLKNCWLGVSVESQKYLDRVMELSATPAAVRFWSVEPLLEDLGNIRGYLEQNVDCVIVGGESGPGKRPFNADWARSIRDQCKEKGVAFFMKQIDKVQPIPDDLMIREFPVCHDLNQTEQTATAAKGKST